MKKKPDWNQLSHLDKLKILRDTPTEQILADYRSGEDGDHAFRARLEQEIALWRPQEQEFDAKTAGAPPNKEVVLGAWRDLDRSEAILELIDNSIDAWNRRRSLYPQKSAPELNIYIDIDSDTGQLVYEDNAGGVPTGRIVNLVVPGHSETDPFAAGIGSYKTGGKKAIFRLATAVNITTRFWNPAETGDTGVTIHLDEQWLTDVDQYEFQYFELNDGGDLQRGQTRYLMQLRNEPIGACWYKNPHDIEKIARDISTTYGLLMSRDGAINIYFPRRGRKIEPALEKLYDFSGGNDGNIDIRPQRVEFATELEYQGKKHKVNIEVVIGTRVTTGDLRDQGPGFDLYGNNRLFICRDIRLFSDHLPKSAASALVRGWVNIMGPNVFIPWDTHKRHLNYDREIIEVLRTHPAITELIKNWENAYNQISRLGKGGIKKTIAETSYKLSDPKTHQLRFDHSNTVPIEAARKRGEKLPKDLFKPVVVSPAKTKKDNGVQLSFSVTTEEARQLSTLFQVHGPLDSPKTRKTISEKAKDCLLGVLKRRRRS